MTSAHQPHGFTLVEVMISVGIVAILAAFTVPNLLGQMPKYRLNGASRQLMGDLLAARMRAVSQNRKVQVFFPDAHQYKICDDANGDGTVANCEGNAQIKDIRGFVALVKNKPYYDVSFLPPPTNNPIFDPRGTASNLATITVSNASGSKKITIAITGRVKIN